MSLVPDDLFSVPGRVACVTGASSGLGRALAREVAEAGARVVGVSGDATESLSLAATSPASLGAVPPASAGQSYLSPVALPLKIT